MAGSSTQRSKRLRRNASNGVEEIYVAVDRNSLKPKPPNARNANAKPGAAVDRNFRCAENPPPELIRSGIDDFPSSSCALFYTTPVQPLLRMPTQLLLQLRTVWDTDGGIQTNMLDNPPSDNLESPPVVLPTRVQPDPVQDDSDEEDVHYTLGLPRGSVVITKRRNDDVRSLLEGDVWFKRHSAVLVVCVLGGTMKNGVVPRLVPSLRGWSSGHLKARKLSEIQAGGFGRGIVEGHLVVATDHQEDAATGGRDSHGHTTIVKTAAEEFADKFVVLGKALDDMCRRTAEDKHEGKEGGATQLEEDMWNNPDNLRVVDAIEKAAQQTNSGQQIPSFTVGLNADIPTQGWIEVEAIVRQYDDVPMNDPLRGSRSQSLDAVSTGIPSFNLALTQEHPTTRWEEVAAIARHYDVVPSVVPIRGSTSHTPTAVCVTNHSSSPDLTEDHPTQLWAEAEAIAHKYDVLPTLDTSHGSTSNPPPAVLSSSPRLGRLFKILLRKSFKVKSVQMVATITKKPLYSTVFNQTTCAAPQKFSRQALGPVVPLRTIDWNSYAPRTRTRTLQMRNAELFNYGGRSAHREDFMLLLEGNEVAIAIISAWASVLNFRQRGKPITAPSRFFVSTATTLDTVSNVVAPRPHRLQLFTERMEAELKLTSYATWGDVDMTVEVLYY
nr:uncharacterized protein LOC109177111 [Ipomoea trifida]